VDRLIETFCVVDDFCQSFMPEFDQMLLSSGVYKRRRCGGLSTSEVMTLLIYFHQSHFGPCHPLPEASVPKAYQL